MPSFTTESGADMKAARRPSRQLEYLRLGTGKSSKHRPLYDRNGRRRCPMCPRGEMKMTGKDGNIVWMCDSCCYIEIGFGNRDV